MSVNSVSASYTATSVKYEATYKSEEVKSAEAAKTESAPKTDSFVRSEDRKDVGYGNKAKGLSKAEIDKIQEQRTNYLKDMVQKLISDQAGKAGSYSFRSESFSFSFEMSSVSSVSGSIYDDPNFGVDAMATKLMDMAISLSGGDSSKAETLVNAVRKGFEMAEKAWGGELPGVCQATLDEVEKRFDYWKENGSMDGYVFGGYTNRETGEQVSVIEQILNATQGNKVED